MIDFSLSRIQQYAGGLSDLYGALESLREETRDVAERERAKIKELIRKTCEDIEKATSEKELVENTKSKNERIISRLIDKKRQMQKNIDEDVADIAKLRRPSPPSTYYGSESAWSSYYRDSDQYQKIHHDLNEDINKLRKRIAEIEQNICDTRNAILRLSKLSNLIKSERDALEVQKNSLDSAAISIERNKNATSKEINVAQHAIQSVKEKTKEVMRLITGELFPLLQQAVGNSNCNIYGANYYFSRDGLDFEIMANGIVNTLSSLERDQKKLEAALKKYVGGMQDSISETVMDVANRVCDEMKKTRAEMENKCEILYKIKATLTQYINLGS